MCTLALTEDISVLLLSSDNFLPPIYLTATVLVSNSLLLQVALLGLSTSKVPSLAQLLDVGNSAKTTASSV